MSENINKTQDSKEESQSLLNEWWSELPDDQKLEFGAVVLDLAGLAASMPENSVTNVAGAALGSLGTITQFTSDWKKMDQTQKMLKILD